MNPIYGQFPVPNPTDLLAKEISLQASKPEPKLLIGNLATPTGQPHTIKELNHAMVVEFNHFWSIPRFDPSVGQTVITPNPNGFHFFN